MNREGMIQYAHKIFNTEGLDYKRRMEFHLLFETMGTISLRRFLITRAIRNRGRRRYADIAKIFGVSINTVKNIALWSQKNQS